MEEQYDGSDITEIPRRIMVEAINSNPNGREALEAEWGQVWDTQQLTEEFNVQSFMAPFVSVTNKATGKSGLMMFQHMPRFYFDFTEE